MHVHKTLKVSLSFTTFTIWCDYLLAPYWPQGHKFDCDELIHKLGAG